MRKLLKESDGKEETGEDALFKKFGLSKNATKEQVIDE